MDGKGVEAKLQHPLDVEVILNTDYIVVCDSYNHKVFSIYLLKSCRIIVHNFLVTLNESID